MKISAGHSLPRTRVYDEHQCGSHNGTVTDTAFTPRLPPQYAPVTDTASTPRLPRASDYVRHSERQGSQELQRPCTDLNAKARKRTMTCRARANPDSLFPFRAVPGLTRPTSPKRRPRRPKTAQEAAKTAQDAAKTAQETLKTIQERTKRAPRRPKSDRRDPQTTQDGLKTAQEGFKTAQEAFQGRPQGAREAKILEKPMVFV